MQEVIRCRVSKGLAHPLATLGGRGRYRATLYGTDWQVNALSEPRQATAQKQMSGLDCNSACTHQTFSQRGKIYEDTYAKIVMKELKNFVILVPIFDVHTVRPNVCHFI
jgi:hypothetical protein